MAFNRSSGTVQNQAINQTYDNQLPGLSAVINAWDRIQDFTGGWASTWYTNAAALSTQIGGLA